MVLTTQEVIRHYLLRELYMFMLIILLTSTFVVLLVLIKNVLASTKLSNGSLVVIKRALGSTKLFTVLFTLYHFCFLLY